MIQRLFKIILLSLCFVISMWQLAHTLTLEPGEDENKDIMAHAYIDASTQFVLDITNLRRQMNDQGIPDRKPDSLSDVHDFFNSALSEFYKAYNLFCRLFNDHGISDEGPEKDTRCVAEFLKSDTTYWQPTILKGPVTRKNYLDFFTAARHVQIMGAVYTYFCNYLTILSRHDRMMGRSAAAFSVPEEIEKITIDSCRSEDSNLANCEFFKKLVANRQRYDVITRGIQEGFPSFFDVIKGSFDKILPLNLVRPGIFIPNELFPFLFTPDAQGLILRLIRMAPEHPESFVMLKNILCKTEKMLCMAETRLWLLSELLDNVVANLQWKPLRQVFDFRNDVRKPEPPTITDDKSFAAWAAEAALLADLEKEEEEAQKKARKKDRRARKKSEGNKRPERSTEEVMGGGGSAGAGSAEKGDEDQGLGLSTEMAPTAAELEPKSPAEPLPPAGAGTGIGSTAAEVPMPTSLPDAAQPAPQAPRINFEEDEAAFDAFIANKEIPNYRKKAPVAYVLGALYQVKEDPSKWPYLAKVVHLILENEDLKPMDFEVEKLFTLKEIGLLSKK